MKVEEVKRGRIVSWWSKPAFIVNYSEDKSMVVLQMAGSKDKVFCMAHEIDYEKSE